MSVHFNIAVQVEKGINSAKLRRQTSMHTENAVIDQSGNWQHVENLNEQK